MIRGQKLIDSDGYEVALYPLESIRITQTCHGSTSHSSYKVSNTGLWDVTGMSGDNPKGTIYAPFTGIVKAVVKGKANGNQTMIQSKNKVHLANGKLDYACFGFAHDNILDIKVGQEVSQGDKVGDCGNYGNVSGVHSHFLIGEGKWTKGNKIPTIVNKNGSNIFYMPNAINIDEMFFNNGIRGYDISNLKKCNDPYTFNWKTWENNMDLSSYKVDRNEFKHQVKVTGTKVNARKTPSLSGEKLGVYVPVGYYNVDETQEADGYMWVKLDTDVWFACVNGAYLDYPASTNDIISNGDLIKIRKDSTEYDYRWTLIGNRYGDENDRMYQADFKDEKLEAQGYEPVIKINGGLSYDYDGLSYANGLEKSRGVNNQELELSAVSDYPNNMAVAFVGSENWYASQTWIINNKLDEAYGAVTCEGVIFNGKKTDTMHAGFETQWNPVSGRQIIGEDKDGNYMIYSFEGVTGKTGLSGKECQTKCLELGFFNALMLDGGGSVFRELLGEVQIKSDRYFKNAIMLYRKKKESDTKDNPKEDPTPTTDYETLYKEEVKKYETLEKDYKALGVENTNLNSELKNTQDELSAVKSDNEQLQTKVTSLNEKIEKIKEVVE